MSGIMANNGAPISASIAILTCNTLQSVAGLAGLRGAMPGSLFLKSNSALTSLGGFDSITKFTHSEPERHTVHIEDLDSNQIQEINKKVMSYEKMDNSVPERPRSVRVSSKISDGRHRNAFVVLFRFCKCTW